MSNSSYKASSPSYGNSGGDSGLGLLLGESLPDTIKIEHVFTLKFSDKWDRPLRKWIEKVVDGWLKLSPHYAESFRFIATGIGSYFFLLGVSRVVAASKMPRGSGSRSNEDDTTTAKKNKTKPKDKKNKAKESKTTATAKKESTPDSVLPKSDASVTASTSD